MRVVFNKITILSIIILLLIGSFSNIFAAKVEVKDIKLNKTNIGLTVGKTAKITATVKPSNATNKTLQWTSSKPKVATVNSKGVVKALSNGTTTITVKSKANKKIIAKCKVSVNDCGVYVSDKVLKIITHDGNCNFTKEDYQYFVRTMYAEAGGTTGSQIMMEMCSATIINIMEQDSYSGRGNITTVLNRTCTATSRLKSFKDSKSAESAVKKALAGSDPTDCITNSLGKKGAIAFSAKGATNSNKNENIKKYKDSNGNIVCIRNKNVYFKSKWNLNLSNFN